MSAKRVQILNPKGEVVNVIMLDVAAFPLSTLGLEPGHKARIETKKNANAKRARLP